MNITIHNLRNEKPKFDYDVKVCRGVSILGNPFFMNDESERDIVCDNYASWLYFNQQKAYIRQELERLVEIHKQHGQLRLFCWCTPKRCHAETIRSILKNMEQNNES